MNALLAGAPRPPVFESHHLKSRARAYFRRGLVLSGALHLGLLALFLALTRGHEQAVRLYSTPAIVLKLPPEAYRPLPEPPAGRIVTTRDGPGEIVPVDEDPVRFDPGEFTAGDPGPFAAGDTGPRETSGPPTGDTGIPLPEDGGFPVSMVQVPPIPIATPTPKYPDWAREAQIEGRVLLHVLISAEGSVKRVVVKSGINGLTEAAVEGIYRWRYRPALMNKRAVPVWLEIPVNFTLR